jgi:Rrf2 family transcriptional regulator, iron-sulfur cluster assembly transcription factor
MKLSTKGRYAMVALVDLARRRARLVSLAEMARRQGSRCPIWSSCSSSCAAPGWSNRCAGRAAATGWRAADAIRVVEVLEAVDETVSAMQKGRGASGGCRARGRSR